MTIIISVKSGISKYNDAYDHDVGPRSSCGSDSCCTFFRYGLGSRTDPQVAMELETHTISLASSKGARLGRRRGNEAEYDFLQGNWSRP